MSNPGTTNLESWWSLDETSGTRADSHGSNDLTDNNTVGATTGKQGNAANFIAANNEYLNIADNASLSMGDNEWTIGAWVNLTSKTSNAYVVSKQSGAGTTFEYWLLYVQAADRFRWAIGNGTTGNRGVIDADSLGSPATSTWYFVLCWHDPVANMLYIQGNNGAVDSAATTGVGVDTGAAFAIGAYSAGTADYLDGLVDEAFIYRRILTSDERTWLYNSGAGRAYADIVGNAVAAAGYTGVTPRFDDVAIVPGAF